MKFAIVLRKQNQVQSQARQNCRMKKEISDHNQTRHESMRIEVCGGIASGKTTFASLLSQLGFDPIYESFQSNPFWEAFYTVPVKYNFETEVCFMLQHYHQIKRQDPKGKKLACDYSFLLDIAYAQMGLKGSKLKAFMTVYEEIAKELVDEAKLKLEGYGSRGRYLCELSDYIITRDE